MRPRYEVAAVIRTFGKDYINTHHPNAYQLRTLRAIRNCRTEAMGGHVDHCSACGQIIISYNSCRNRHCPKCQGVQREDWIKARTEDLLPVAYYHVVFTLPDTLNQLCLYQPVLVYGLLFKAAWETISMFAIDPKYLGAMPGMVAVLHTWGQNLSLHPHLHCLVPAGGVSVTNKWVNSKNKAKYLFPVKAMSIVFRAKYTAMLKRTCKKQHVRIEPDLFEKLYQNNWVVYTKLPFKGVNSVLEYLGRYTHRIAICNHRIINIDDTYVSFYYKDYRDENKQKILTITGIEFLRRFTQHILPKGFVRVRHYGFLSSTQKPLLRRLQKNFGILFSSGKKSSELDKKPYEICPVCGNKMIRTKIIRPKRGPPLEGLPWSQILKYV